MANVSETLHTNFYQNPSTFAEAMHKSILVCFMTHSVELVVMERRLWWFGHVLRMDEDRLARQALQWELDTARWKANRSGKTGATLYASRSKGCQYVEI